MLVVERAVIKDKVLIMPKHAPTTKPYKEKKNKNVNNIAGTVPITIRSRFNEDLETKMFRNPHPLRCGTGTYPPNKRISKLLALFSSSL